MEVAAAKNRTKPRGNKLADGPCSKAYERLEACAMRRGVARENEKDRMQACPSETDVLIRCIHKNPLFFRGG